MVARNLKIKRSRQVEWGYDVDPDNPRILIPDDDALDLYDEGVELLSKGRSYSQIAKWITECTGRRLTREALWKKVDKARRERLRAKYLENVAQFEEKLRAYCEKNTAATHQAQKQNCETNEKEPSVA